MRQNDFSDLDVREGPSEPRFDRIVQRAASSFAAPISVLALIDDKALWVRAATGLDLKRLPRKSSFFSYAVGRTEILEVCDARSEAQFQMLSAVVGEPYVRYYLSAPLAKLNGKIFGALCVVDTRPRDPTTGDQRAYLTGLARQAAQALERRAHITNGLVR